MSWKLNDCVKTDRDVGYEEKYVIESTVPARSLEEHYIVFRAKLQALRCNGREVCPQQPYNFNQTETYLLCVISTAIGESQQDKSLSRK